MGSGSPGKLRQYRGCGASELSGNHLGFRADRRRKADSYGAGGDFCAGSRGGKGRALQYRGG